MLGTPVPVDAKNAPTRDLETTEQFPQRQQRSFFLEGQEEPTKNLSTPILEQIGCVFQFRRAAVAIYLRQSGNILN
jgi:hypothetical protein